MLGCSAHYDERTAMTNKESFTEEEWELIREAPTSAGMIVLTAQKGGSFRESFAMAKAYTEARQQHAGSELLDAVVSAKPARDHTHYHSPDELKAAGLGHLRDAVALARAEGDAAGSRGLPGLRADAGRQGRARAQGGRRRGQRRRTAGDRGDRRRARNDRAGELTRRGPLPGPSRSP